MGYAKTILLDEYGPGCDLRLPKPQTPNPKHECEPWEEPAYLAVAKPPWGGEGKSPGGGQEVDTPNLKEFRDWYCLSLLNPLNPLNRCIDVSECLTIQVSSWSSKRPET